MPKKDTRSSATTQLRQSAEARLKERNPGAPDSQTLTYPLRLVHELEVHEIELKQQNEELNRAREDLQAELQKYCELFELAPVANLTLDREGTILEANLQSASLLGIERARLVTRRLGILIAAADRPAFADLLTRVFTNEGRETCEVSLDGGGRPSVPVRIEAAKASSGLACRVVLHDLTTQKRAEADRLIVSKLESTGILAGGIAHDFNNLLTVLLLDLEMVRLSEPSGSEAKEWLDDAKQAIARAQALTTQLITFADGGAPVRKPACLSDFVRASVRQGVDGSALTTSFTVADDLWWVQVDSDQFAQVIRNLVANAREAMPHGGLVSVGLDNVVLDAAHGVALPAGRYVCMSLTDQGGGIPAEVLPKIFDPYFSTKQRGNQKGMGLGLTICHAIVRKHGGAITVLANPGVGTTFQIHLPACEPGTGKAK